MYPSSSRKELTTPPRKEGLLSRFSPSLFSLSGTFQRFSPVPSNYKPISETNPSPSEQLIDCATPITDKSTPSNTPIPLGNSILCKQSGKWQILRADDPDIQEFPFGCYNYVVMANGEIRVQTTLAKNPLSHNQLANGMPVRSAGQLFFSQSGTQELVWWNNRSKDYPSETIHEDIGLPLEDFDKCPSEDSKDNDDLVIALTSPCSFVK